MLYSHSFKNHWLIDKQFCFNYSIVELMFYKFSLFTILTFGPNLISPLISIKILFKQNIKIMKYFYYKYPLVKSEFF